MAIRQTAQLLHLQPQERIVRSGQNGAHLLDYRNREVDPNFQSRWISNQRNPAQGVQSKKLPYRYRTEQPLRNQLWQRGDQLLA